jgi:MFS family permease
MTTIKISQTFTALKHPNFRLWFIGQVVSLVGTWMQSTAQGYLVYELTHSASFLGIVAFAGGLPTLMFTLYGGVIADRISRRKMIIITQSTMMVLAFILAALTFTSLVQPWHIIILAFLLGTANAFDAPARQSFIVEMVDREDLSNAIALNSTIFNLGTVIGPTVAGLVYAWLGPAWCFTVNGISFIAVIGALLLMKMAKSMPRLEKGSPLLKLKEGLQYVFHEKRVRLILVYLGIVSIFGFSLMTLVPAWAVKILGGDVRTNGCCFQPAVWEH